MHDPVIHQSQKLRQGLQVREVVLEQPSYALSYDLLQLDKLARITIFLFVAFAKLCLVLIAFFLLFVVLAFFV